MKAAENDEKFPNKDVITEAGESRPVATDVGGLAGAATGAVIGSSLGPLGAVTGAVIGASTGMIAGKAIAVALEPSAEEAYRERNSSDQPLYESDFSVEDFSPAYRLGCQMFAPGVSFESVENDLKERWGTEESKLSWDLARDAAKAGWDRVEQLHGAKAKPDLQEEGQNHKQ
jgi:hypothetical protein